MRYSLISFICCFIFSGVFTISAQTQEKGGSTLLSGTQIIADIQDTSEGRINITIPDEIVELIFTDAAPKKVSVKKNNNRKEAHGNKGYRVQVFGEAGNQATLATRCRARGSMVLAKFPKYRGQIYIFSKSPHWYCRIGNFRTSAEAAKAAGELRRAFPQFSGEIRTVQSTIVPK